MGGVKKTETHVTISPSFAASSIQTTSLCCWIIWQPPNWSPFLLPCSLYPILYPVVRGSLQNCRWETIPPHCLKAFSGFLQPKSCSSSQVPPHVLASACFCISFLATLLSAFYRTNGSPHTLSSVLAFAYAIPCAWNTPYYPYHTNCFSIIITYLILALPSD